MNQHNESLCIFDRQNTMLKFDFLKLNSEVNCNIFSKEEIS